MYDRILRNLIYNQSITPHFQPIFDLVDGKVLGYEVLSRGMFPFESPALLFDAARRQGLCWDLERACRMAAFKKIASLSKDFREGRFFLNVSPDLLEEPSFYEGFTLSKLEEHGIDQSKLVIEITETVAVSDYARLERMVHHYVKQGFKIALDDFGAGHSGLVTLVALTPQFLKLDRELIRSIECNPYKQQLVKAIGSFAQNVDTRLIAEGVETSKELETLMELGIRYVQGFLLAHPRPEPARFSSQMWDELCGMRGKRRKRSSRSWLDMGYGSAAARLVSSAPMLLPFL